MSIWVWLMAMCISKTNKPVRNVLQIRHWVLFTVKKTAYENTLFKSFCIKKNKIIIRFSNTYGALKSADNNPLKSIATAGEDKKFVWADAKLEGKKVIVWNNVIKSPKYVRYGWADNPDCNLQNGIGLPVIPFRTDN